VITDAISALILPPIYAKHPATLLSYQLYCSAQAVHLILSAGEYQIGKHCNSLATLLLGGHYICNEYNGLQVSFIMKYIKTLLTDFQVLLKLVNQNLQSSEFEYC